MKRSVNAVVFGVAAFALGAVLQRIYDTSRVIPARTPQASKSDAEAPLSVGAGNTTVPIELFEHEPLWGVRLRQASGAWRAGPPSESAVPGFAPERTSGDAEPAEANRREQRGILARGYP